jgi:hypothetical protein
MHAPALKEKIVGEFKEYWGIVFYLTVMLSAFTSYRRLVLSESGIGYLHYGFAVAQSLILGKVILLGRALGLDRRFQTPPLIKVVLFKSVLFGALFWLFTILEHLVEGLVHREVWSTIVHSLVRSGTDEILARAIMVIVTFVPFFSFLEADRVMGEGKLFALFFRKEAAPECARNRATH